MYTALDIEGLTRRYDFLGHKIRFTRHPQREVGILSDGGRFPLTWTKCNYGGYRAWFKCPGCSRRTNRLFAPHKQAAVSAAYACRLCHKIEYNSQMDTIFFPGMRKLQSAARRLGVHHLTPPERVVRPAGMHRRTYERLLENYRRAHNRMESTFETYIEESRRRLDKIAANLGTEG
jgi:hypothetical protein